MKINYHLIFIIFLPLIFSCNYYNDSKVKGTGKIIINDNKEFIESINKVVEAIREKGNTVVQSDDFNKFLINGYNNHKKSFKVTNRKTKAVFSLQFFVYNNLEGSNLATERLYTRLGDVAELPNNNKSLKNKPIFGVLNNYGITVLEYECKNKASEKYSNTLIPILFQNLKKTDSKIMNLRCDTPLIR